MLLLVTGCESSSETTIDTPGGPVAVAPAAQANANAAAANTMLGPGEVTTRSGLRYKVLKSGPADGRSPAIDDAVTVDYRGTLTNGTVFDSSIERGMPAQFRVNQVIPGWTEALQLMKPGDKWMLYIPARLAYGSQAVGDKIPGNSDLIFQVELLRVGS